MVVAAMLEEVAMANLLERSYAIRKKQRAEAAAAAANAAASDDAAVRAAQQDICRLAIRKVGEACDLQQKEINELAKTLRSKILEAVDRGNVALAVEVISSPALRIPPQEIEHLQKLLSESDTYFKRGAFSHGQLCTDAIAAEVRQLLG
jgi:hypothetical protein